MFELAEALFHSIRAQLSVVKYQALGRGANLDGIDVPLNNRTYLLKRFAQIRQERGRGAAARGIGRHRELD